MKTLYLECSMGAAGDMLTAALLELHPSPTDFLQRLNALGIPKTTISAEKTQKCGITGTHMSVLIDGEEEHEHTHHHHHHEEQEHHQHEEHTHHHHAHTHAHSSLHDIAHMVSHFDIPQRVQEDILAVYRLIAEAESAAHDKPVSEIHFHEVGTLDAVADVTAVCLLMYELAPERIVASPVHVGSGHVHCAHGILPVPAPATAFLLRGVPSYGGAIKGELCTPTGAALLKHFVQEFGAQPTMRVEKIGYGMGKKDFETANCVRAFLGETEGRTEDILELRCNLDDMTPEALAFASEQLLENGALDVYTIPIGMKKARSAMMLTCMCRPAQKEQMLSLLFRHTTTLGVRECAFTRHALTRTACTAETPYGKIRYKESSGWGITRRKAEYDDLSGIARAQHMTLRELEEVFDNSLK